MLSALISKRMGEQRASAVDDAIIHALTDEWFPEQRAFYDDPAQLCAVIKGRRAGGTKGTCGHLVRQALLKPASRILYLNSTRPEARQLAWYGLKNDGMASLCRKHDLDVRTDETRLEIRFSNDSLIQLRGADDEAELRKALGFAYHELVWDEAQKIPPKLAQSIREVVMPTLLDFGGRLRLVGTPVRQMSGLFYDVTKPQSHGERLAGWSVHHWTLLQNTFFGATEEERFERGIIGLQTLLGGPQVAPLDSPIMQREAFGRWVREDASYVYAVHKIPQAQLFYAPHRPRVADGFVDVPAALKDLPFPVSEAFFSMGADLGYNDPFALTLLAWHPHDPCLYEVVSWKKSYLTADEQIACLKAVREHVVIGQIVTDAGAAKMTTQGWSKEWVERYGLPIIEANKQQKHTAIEILNTDFMAGGIKLREGGPLYKELSLLQWLPIVSGSGKPIEDPTMDNHCCDSFLYSHRHSYAYRHTDDPRKALNGMDSVQRLAAEGREIEEDAMDDDLSEYLQ